MNTNTRTTALAIMALGRADPKNALLANAVRWLMVARKEGHWETTQVTAWSVLALTEFMAATGELSGELHLPGGAQRQAPRRSVAWTRTTWTRAASWKVAMRDLVCSAARPRWPSPAAPATASSTTAPI